MLLIAALTAAQSFAFASQAVTVPGDESPAVAAAGDVLSEIITKDTKPIRFGMDSRQGGAASAGGEKAAKSTVSEKATFLFSKERAFGDDDEIGWPGFLHGLRGFEHFYNPVGQPLYFETPFNETGVRFLYINHEFPNNSQIGGGRVIVGAMQIRVALTDRLGFIATKDGRSWLRAGAFPRADGWNDLTLGLKYVAIADYENDFVVTPGIRWMLEQGDHSVLQGRRQEYSPFVSVAKGFGNVHAIGNVTWRIPETSAGNNVLHFDAHLDWEFAPKKLPGFAPLVEVHSVHYLTDGEALPLTVGGLDYTNLGSRNVAGEGATWFELGFRQKFSPNFSLGMAYGLPMSHRETDLFENRLTIDFELKW